MRVAMALSSLALVGLLAGAGPARAEEEKSCRQQIEDLCPNTSPNTPERRSCVQNGMEKLSAPCQQQLGHIRAMGMPPSARTPDAPGAAAPAAGGLQDLVKACSKDHPRMVELCQSGKKPGENPLPCLTQHIGEFSESCQAWIRGADAASAKGAPPKPGNSATPPPAPAKPPGAPR
ncbi:MAG TPA: hypothetical protein VMS55_02150 [Myxococcota bacterium]|nr:hypothetical protein [Myxococcota bacterium]